MIEDREQAAKPRGMISRRLGGIRAEEKARRAMKYGSFIECQREP